MLGALGVGQRLLLEQAGRHVNALSLEDRSKIVRPWTVDDYRESGDLTVLTGAAIYDVFRAQLPINPRMYTVENLLDVRPDYTYLLMNDHAVFQRLKRNVSGLKIYRSGGIIFNGVSIPKAFILVTSREKSDILTEPIGFPERILPGTSRRYLYLAKVDPGILLDSENSGTINFNLILESENILHDGDLSKQLLEGPGEIYVLGNNALRADPSTRLSEGRLLLYDGHRSERWYQGKIDPPTRSFFAVGLSVLLAAVAFLGLFLQGYPLRWALWLLAGIAVFFTPDWHLLLLGLLGAGLFKLGLRVRGFSVAWFLLAGLIVYGFGYKPYEFVPFQSQVYFWVGAVGGFALVSSGWQNRLESPVKYHELIVLGACLGVFSLVVPGIGFAWNLKWLTLSTAMLPVFPLILGTDDGMYNLVWATGISAWGASFLRETVLVAPFYFLGVLVVWGIFRYLGRNDTIMTWEGGFR